MQGAIPDDRSSIEEEMAEIGRCKKEIDGIVNYSRDVLKTDHIQRLKNMGDDVEYVIKSIDKNDYVTFKGLHTRIVDQVREFFHALGNDMTAQMSESTDETPR